MIYYNYEFTLPEMLSYIQFNHRQLKTNSELHHWQWNISGYNVQQIAQQNPSIQVQVWGADILTDKMGMNTRSKHQNDVKEKVNRGKKKWESKQIIGAASQSHWDLFQDFCWFSVWSASHKSRALQCCFPVLENQMQWTLHITAQRQIIKGNPDKDICPLPIYVASQLGKCSLPAFYTDQLEVQQGCSDRGGI